MNTSLCRFALLALSIAFVPSCSDAPAADYARTYESAAKHAQTGPDKGLVVRQPVTSRLTETYKHPSGAVFRHPGDWSVQPAGDGALALDPQDLRKVDGERAELFLVTGEAAQGISAVSDPRVASTVEQMVRQTFPYLKRDGAPADANGALLLRFTGRRNQIEFRAEMRVKLLSGFALGTFAMTDQSRFAARSRVMRSVFDSIGYEKPKSDPRVVGHWRYSKTYISGSFSSITVRNLVLHADGTCLEGGKLMAGMSHSDSSGNFSGSSNASHQQGVDYRGRWQLNGKMLTMNWDNGSTEAWSIYIEGNSMLWKSGKSRKLWKKLR